jgi:cobalt-zinc-cadmium efflux system outer membrane protein
MTAVSNSRTLAFACAFPKRAAVSLFAAVLVVAVGASGAAAQADTLRVGDAVRAALDGNPMLQAARYSAAAAANRVGPAGSLPDPHLQFGSFNNLISAYGTNVMQMKETMLMQTVPWPGKLSSARSAARHLAGAASEDAEEQARMLAAQVRMTYYDLAYSDRALEVMRRTQGLLRQFLEVSTTMYAVGAAVQQDVLRAQVEVALMTEDITRMEQDRLAGALRLNALMGRDGMSPIGPVELPEPVGDLPEADSLVARALYGRPALRAGAERVAAAEASLSAAHRWLIPDLQLGAGAANGPILGNLVSFTVGFDVPIFARWKQHAMSREATAMREMAEAELRNRRNETVARIIETRARAVRDQNLAHVHRVSIVPQARATVQAALASYRVGRVTFMQLIDNQMTVNRHETESYRLLADYHQAVADLEAMVGQPLEDQP